MVDLPESLAKGNFRKLFTPGGVFFQEKYVFEDGTSRQKFIVVLNSCDSSGYSYVVLPTSQVEKIRNTKVLLASAYFFPMGAVECFSKDTAVVLRNILKQKFVTFEHGYNHSTRSQRLEYRCHLSGECLSGLYTAIVASRDISLSTKRLILPSRYFAND